MNPMPVTPSVKRYAPALFLDFDGVLHPNLSAPEQRFVRLPMLADALGESDVQIIVSSSWRFEWSLSQLKALFPESIRMRVVGTTGPAHIGRHARWNEIKTYCSNQRLTNWRALDDAHFEFPNPCEQLIRCEGSRGIGQAQCDALRTWLSGYESCTLRLKTP